MELNVNNCIKLTKTICTHWERERMIVMCLLWWSALCCTYKYLIKDFRTNLVPQRIHQYVLPKGKEAKDWPSNQLMLITADNWSIGDNPMKLNHVLCDVLSNYPFIMSINHPLSLSLFSLSILPLFLFILSLYLFLPSLSPSLSSSLSLPSLSLSFSPVPPSHKKEQKNINKWIIPLCRRQDL